jgi:sodium/potassium-transporting ATPase subunit alpha
LIGIRVFYLLYLQTCKIPNLQFYRNWVINFGAVFEIAIVCGLSYIPGLAVLNCFPLRFNWWLAALPFAVTLFAFEEIRKFIIRTQPRGSWVERETLY